MNKVIAFGDSFTYGHELSDCPTNNYPTHSKLSYAALTAAHLSREYDCKAVGAYANNAISRRILDSLDTIDNTDLVLVMWTYPIRREFLLQGDLGFRNITPQDNFEFAKTYFRYLDCNPAYLISESLKEIYIAQSVLNAKSINYVFISTDTGLSTAVQTKDLSYGKLCSEINSNRWLFLENNLGFADWAKDELKLVFGNRHPPDIAHKVLFNKLIEKINE